MKPPARVILFVCGLFIPALVGERGVSAIAGVQHNPMPLIPQPSGIVPFEADYVRTEVTPTGRHVWVGRFYRGADNSFRREWGPSPGNVTTVNVRNVQHGVLYVWSKASGHSMYPLVTPPGGWSATGRRASFEEPVAEKVEGFHVLKISLPNALRLEVPDLNLFAIYDKTWVDDGTLVTEERYTNIKVRQQPAELFEPPS